MIELVSGPGRKGRVGSTLQLGKHKKRMARSNQEKRVRMRWWLPRTHAKTTLGRGARFGGAGGSPDVVADNPQIPARATQSLVGTRTTKKGR